MATVAEEGGAHRQNCRGKALGPSQCLWETDKEDRDLSWAGPPLFGFSWASLAHLLCSQVWGVPKGGYC